MEARNIYAKTVVKNVLILAVSSDIDGPAAYQIIGEIERALETQPSIKAVVFNLQKKFTLQPAAFRPLGAFGLELRKQGRLIYLLDFDFALKKYLVEAGITALLIPALSLENILVQVSPPAPASKSVDVDFLNPFIEGTVETLKIQCSIHCKTQKAVLKDDLPQPLVYDIAGVIGLTSPAFNGSIAICFPAKTFLAAMSNMIGEKCEEITKDVEDGAGELLNIIFGHAKKILNNKGYALEKAIPTIIRGSQLEVKHLSSTKTIVLQFETDYGNFCIEIATEIAT